MIKITKNYVAKTEGIKVVPFYNLQKPTNYQIIRIDTDNTTKWLENQQGSIWMYSAGGWIRND